MHAHSLLLVLVLLAATIVGTAQTSERGRVVVHRGPDDVLVISTVVALPGDAVTIRDGAVLVNGQPTGRRVEGAQDWGPRVVGDGDYFVLGDPANTQHGSYAWGLVPRVRIVGVLALGAVPR